ncbi:MAG: glycosyltransferase family 4 protein [Candidatus Woesearchaeota archaeon]
MRVLMFGWEFPPYNSGGLGTACFGLTKGLTNQGVDVTFVIPKALGELGKSHVDLVVADQVKRGLKIKEIDSLLVPYISSVAYSARLRDFASKKANDSKTMYGSNLYQEVYRYSQQARHIAKQTKFDVIHCHDWMTYPAGIQVKRMTKKPLVLHIHATEFDRTGGNPNQVVYDIEREGFHTADKICAVSNFTKQKVVEHYGVSPDKVEVVHNAVEFSDPMPYQDFPIKKNDRIVLFLGRITLQKGPEYFLYAARKVLDYEKNVKFLVVGTGDMEHFMIDKAAELGIADKVLFAGFMRGKDIDRAYKMADLYVMPSVSEPFGITPLEAMRNGTPVIISKQSGVSEVINHCFKIDFWDIDEMANKIISVLRYKELHECLSDSGSLEVRKFNWNEPAAKCIKVYNQVLGIT